MKSRNSISLACMTLCALGFKPVAAQEQAQSAVILPEVVVVGTSPVGKTGIPASKFAGNVQTLSNDHLTTDTLNLTQRLDQSLGSVNINDTQGNSFQVDLNYRGFTASPALGTPQGLSVFLDGMRLNEPFGDIVSWDSVPQLAIDKVTLIPGSNPVYGLNTLGGAIALTTKNGNTFNGSQGGVSVGSFGRVSLDLEHGSHTEDGNLYFATSLYNDRGWAEHNPSQVRQVFGKYTRYISGGDAVVSLLYADNLLYGNQTVPTSMLDKAAQGYSHPDYTGSQTLILNALVNVDLDESNAMSGNLYVRDISRDILNSNINNLLSSSTNDASCTGNVTIDCPATNLLAQYKQQVLGTNLQWSNTDLFLDKNQVTTLGVNAEFSDAAFASSGQYATLDSTYGLMGAGSFMSQAEIKSNNQRYGVFATSTFDATARLSVTASVRYDYAKLKLSGNSCIDNDLCDLNAGAGQVTAVTGEHSYHRVNPSLGFTFLVAPELTVFGNYAEGFRTPSAIELACADPAAPCSGVPNAFGADPELQAVVSKTREVGMRGRVANLAKWRASYYRTEMENDILFNQSSLSTGYFSNVGHTLRQGIEIGVDGRVGPLDYSVDLDRIEATYQSGYTVANTANSAAATPVQPGNRIPGIPQWVLKSRFSYPITTQTRLGLGIQSQGSHFARGDDNNADVNGQIAGFTTVKLDVQHSVNKRIHLYAGINNLFDAKYVTYGALATNNITGGTAEQFQSLGAPRTIYSGLQASF